MYTTLQISIFKLGTAIEDFIIRSNFRCNIVNSDRNLEICPEFIIRLFSLFFFQSDYEVLLNNNVQIMRIVGCFDQQIQFCITGCTYYVVYHVRQTRISPETRTERIKRKKNILVRSLRLKLLRGMQSPNLAQLSDSHNRA